MASVSSYELIRATEALAAFEALCDRLERYGTRDTESQGVMCAAIAREIRRQDRWLPVGSGDWQIYRSVPGHEQAAHELTEALLPILDAVFRLRGEDLKTFVRRCPRCLGMMLP